jgi:hypothetical protein
VLVVATTVRKQSDQNGSVSLVWISLPFVIITVRQQLSTSRRSVFGTQRTTALILLFTSKYYSTKQQQWQGRRRSVGLFHVLPYYQRTVALVIITFTCWFFRRRAVRRHRGAFRYVLYYDEYEGIIMNPCYFAAASFLGYEPKNTSSSIGSARIRLSVRGIKDKVLLRSTCTTTTRSTEKKTGPATVARSSERINLRSSTNIDRWTGSSS